MVVDNKLNGNGLSCIPLTRTCNWYDNNHFTLTHLYMKWLEELVPKGFFAPEFYFIRPLTRRNCQDNMNWYIYGSIGDDPRLVHLDGRHIAPYSQLVKEYCPDQFETRPSAKNITAT